MGSSNSKTDYETPIKQEKELQKTRHTALTPEKLAIKKEIEMLNDMTKQIDTRDDLILKMQNVTVKVEQNVATMKDVGDTLATIKNGPMELKPFLISLTNTCELWETTQPLIQEFNGLAKSIFYNNLLINYFSIDKLASEADACRRKLTQLEQLYTDIMRKCDLLWQECKHVQTSFDGLASSVQQKEGALKRDRLVIVAKGFLGALEALGALGILLGYILYQIGAKQDVGMTAADKAASDVLSFFETLQSDFSKINEELKSIRDLQKKLKQMDSWNTPFLLFTKEVTKGEVVREADSCEKRLRSRLADRVKAIELEQENEQLRQEVARLRAGSGRAYNL